MTKRNISVTVETDDPPQLNKTRAEYIDGDISEAELEERIERSLERGPTIGNGGESGSSNPSLLTYIRNCASGVWVVLFLKLLLAKSDDSVNASYDVASHRVRAIDSDPDPNDHPAESAGSQQALLGLMPQFGYLMVAYFVGGLLEAVPATSTAAMVLVPLLLLIGVASFLSLQAGSPTVEVTDEGVGTHVAD